MQKHIFTKNLINNWSTGNYDARIEEGESIADLIVRLKPFIESLKKRKEKNILVCSHGRTLRCMMVLLRKQRMREMETYNHKNTGLYKVQYERNQFYLELENDRSHLAK